jgi:predicted RNase H-like HicB family nuclease
MAAMPELDRDFYVKNLLATDGEPEPSDPEPLREYRASRRYHILWTELKEAAARIASLEEALAQSGARIAELEETLRKAGVPASLAEKD